MLHAAGARGARFCIQQNGFDDGAQAAIAAAEHAGHSGHIGRAGIAGHQPLDQLFADEGGGVRMGRQAVERQAQAQRRIGRGLGRDRDPQEALFACRVRFGVAAHRHPALQGEVVAACRGPEAAPPFSRVASGAVPAPAREHLGQPPDIVGGISFDGLAIAQLEAAVIVEFVQSDGKQLHHFAREVLVRDAAADRIFLAVLQRGEVDAHGRVQCHRFQQFAVGAATVLDQHVHVAGNQA